MLSAIQVINDAKESELKTDLTLNIVVEEKSMKITVGTMTAAVLNS